MYTIEDIIELDPCEEYTREKLEELWEGKESLALREILELTIPIDDRNWVMPRLVPTEIVIKWAHLCAHKAKKHATAARSAGYAGYAAARSADAARYAAAGYAAARSAGYAGYAAARSADAARYAAAARYAGYAGYAGHAAGYAASTAANAGYAASTAANAGYAWDETGDKELYRLLTILCNMEEDSK